MSAIWTCSATVPSAKRFQAEADYWATASVVKALSDEEARDIYSHRPAKAEAYIGLKLVR